MRSQNLIKTIIWLLIVVDIYMLTFFIFARPMLYAGRPNDLYTLELKDKRVCPVGTVIYFSKSPTIHAVAYYFYYPCHTLLGIKGFMFMYSLDESRGLFSYSTLP